MRAPRFLENLLRLLLPPASREHVLGDLQERYKSPGSYLIDGLSVLAPVIISRIRRTTDFQVFVMEALTLYLSLTTAAWCLGQQSFLYDNAGFVVLALPTSVAAVALLFCNAYSDLERRSVSKPIVQSAGSLSLAVLGQAIVFDAQPSLAVPSTTMLYGSLLGLVFLSSLRTLFPPVQSRPRPARAIEHRLTPGVQFVPVNPIKHLLQRVRQRRYEPKLNPLFISIVVLAVVVLLVAYRIRTGE